MRGEKRREISLHNTILLVYSATEKKNKSQSPLHLHLDLISPEAREGEKKHSGKQDPSPLRPAASDPLVIGMEEEVDSGTNMVEQEDNTGSVSRTLVSRTRPKRLRSKVWDDFTPIYVGRKITKAECLHCHQVFNSNSSSGTSNLLKHQSTCSPRAKRKPMQQSQGSDPTQRKLSFFPISQKKCLGTADARPEKKDLALLDIPNDTNHKSEEVNQSVSHEELGSPEQDDLALPDNATDTKTGSQQVDQNGSHEELATAEQENQALPDNPIDKSTKNQSHEELALPEQKVIPTDTSCKNLDVGQDGSHGELVRKLAIHGYLPSMMDHGGLRKSVGFLNPTLKIPSYADLMSTFLDVFDNEKAKLKEKFAALCSRVCLSVYVWHYDSLSAFLCLSVHYIDDEWERQQKIITFRSMDTICNAAEMSDAILKAIRDWGLCGKVFSIILDDAFIDDSVASNVKAHLQKENSSSAKRSLFVVRYGTHLLDQVIQVGLDELDKIMEKSANCSKDNTMGPNSSAVHYPNFKYAPSQEDWGEAHKMCETLEEFHQYVDTIQCLRWPVHLFDKILDVKRDMRFGLEHYADGSYSNMLKKMQQTFKKYWKLCCLHLCMPLVMDPSYSLKHVTSSRHYYKTDTDGYSDDVRDILLGLFYEYSGQTEDPSSTSASRTSRESVIVSEDGINEDDLSPAYCNHYGDKCSELRRPMTELNQYLHEAGYCRGQTSVLQWWKEHDLTYPTIARMARDILAIPYKSDYEVAITTARLAICESGHKHWVEELVCAQDWLGPNRSASKTSTSELSD